MRTIRLALLLAAFTLPISLTLAAQTVVDTVFVGTTPTNVAVNPATNKIYVVNQDDNTVAVLDGATDVVTTIPVGSYPGVLAVNTVTNKIYVPNYDDGTVTVIDGATNTKFTIHGFSGPWMAAVNSVTNKIYVVDSGDDTLKIIDGASNGVTQVAVRSDPEGLAVNPVTNKVYVFNHGENTVTAVDGATLATTTVLVGHQPNAIAVNQVTNKIFVTNKTDSTVTVIDGVTNHTSTVTLADEPESIAINPVTDLIYVGDSNWVLHEIRGDTLAVANYDLDGDPRAITVNPVTNKIYIAGGNDLMMMMDGVTHATTDIEVGNYPVAIDRDLVSNRLYVVNGEDNTVSVIAGANPTALQFVPITPCRVVDTRGPQGPFGGPALAGLATRDFVLPNGGCTIPYTAQAYSLNVTVVPHGTLSYLTVWPSGEDRPLVSTLNSLDGRIKANAAIIPAGAGEAISVFATQTTDLVLDINGYFVPASGMEDASSPFVPLGNPGGLQFYPVTPCRVIDTRWPDAPLGGPILPARTPRDFPIRQSSCGIPSTAQAYSLNLTVVPPGPLGYLTVWPSDENMPVVSTLNDLTGTIVANAGIVPGAANGDLSAYADTTTHLVVDINGYFAPASANGLSLYATAPCRVLDTRKSGGQFNGKLRVDVVDTLCGVASDASAYVFNATVVPRGTLGYLTLWPDNASMPVVSTLNAMDGAITSNMAVVPDSLGWIDAYASGWTHLILDISSYFAK